MTVTKVAFPEARDRQDLIHQIGRSFQQWAAVVFSAPASDEFNEDYLIAAEAFKGRHMVQGRGVYAGFETKPKLKQAGGTNPFTGEEGTFKRYPQLAAPPSWGVKAPTYNGGTKLQLRPDKTIEDIRGIGYPVTPEDEGYDPENTTKEYWGQPGTWQPDGGGGGG